MTSIPEFAKIVAVDKKFRLVIAFRKIHSRKGKRPYVIFQGLEYEIEPALVYSYSSPVLGTVSAFILNPFGTDREITIKPTFEMQKRHLDSIIRKVAKKNARKEL